MSSFLVLYGSSEGQTAKVAERVESVLAARGHDATVVRAGETEPAPAPAEFDAVLVGASVHYGKHQSPIVEYVRSNRDALATMPTAFFQVSLASATEEGRAQAAGYVESFLEETGWHPDRIGLFGGALRYAEYGFLKRLLMKQLVKRKLPEVDPARDAEFTDWDEVEAFTADVAAFVEGRLGITPPNADSHEESV